MVKERSQGIHGALLGVSLVALFAGYVLGASGIFSAHPEGSPEERVSQVLKSPEPQLSSGDWRQVRADVQKLRKGLAPFAVPIFELVAELHGLNDGGKTDWKRAQSLCEGLSWTRCDKDELEEMKRRGRP